MRHTLSRYITGASCYSMYEYMQKFSPTFTITVPTKQKFVVTGNQGQFKDRSIPSNWTCQSWIYSVHVQRKSCHYSVHIQWSVSPPL